MGLLASLRSDDSDQGVSFDALVGTQSRLQKGGLRPSVWLHFLKKAGGYGKGWGKKKDWDGYLRRKGTEGRVNSGVYFLKSGYRKCKSRKMRKIRILVL